MGGRQSKQLGYTYEVAVKGHLKPHYPLVKRNGSQYGAKDRGDLGGVPAWTIQCKNVAQDRWHEWFEATTQQAVHGSTRWWVVVRKARNRSVGESLFCMSLDKGTELMTHLQFIETELERVRARNIRLERKILELRSKNNGHSREPAVRRRWSRPGRQPDDARS